MRPIASQRLVAHESEQPFFLGRWADGGLTTLGFAASATPGTGDAHAGLVALHHGPSGSVDWLVHLNSAWTPTSFAGIGESDAWIAARGGGIALLARIHANGTIGGQAEIMDTMDPELAHAAAIVDGTGHAYLVTSHAVVRADDLGQALWAFEIQARSGASALWSRPDPHGGIVVGTGSSPLRAASISADGLVRWSREVVLAADHEAAVLDAQIDADHGTTLLIQETTVGVSGHELVVVRIDANGATTSQPLRSSFAAFASAELIEYAPIDAGRGGWGLLLMTSVSPTLRAYDALFVDPRGTVVWSHRIERSTSSLLGASLVAFMGGGVAVRFVYAVAPFVRIVRFDNSGGVMWKRGLESTSSLIDDEPPLTLPAPSSHGLELTRDRARQDPNASGAEAHLGLGQVLALARADAGMFLPAYVVGTGLVVCGIDVAGNLEWAARIAASGSLTSSVLGPNNTGFLHGSSSGVPFLVRLDSAASGRWKSSGFEIATLVPTTDAGVIVAHTVGSGANEDVAWLSIRRDGTSDAACAPLPEALVVFSATLAEIEIELTSIDWGPSSTTLTRSITLPRAAISSRQSRELQAATSATVPFDACEPEMR